MLTPRPWDGKEPLRHIGDAGQEVAHEVGAAALPGSAWKRRGDCVDSING
jgi:hypothetical protein